MTNRMHSLADITWDKTRITITTDRGMTDEFCENLMARPARPRPRTSLIS